MRRYHRGTVPVLFYKTPTMTRRADRLSRSPNCCAAGA